MSDKIKILVVEDVAIVAENTRLTLEELNYEVTSVCYSFEEAIDSITSAAFDIALLDINLNEGDQKTGLALADHINSTVKKPFIFLTAYNDRQTILESAKLSPYGYLIKPVNTHSLFASIQIAIARAQSPGIPEKILPKNTPPDFFFSKLGNKIFRVEWSSIKLIRASKNYIRLFSMDNPGSPYLLRTSLSQVLHELMPARIAANFLKPGRAALVVKEECAYIQGNVLFTKHFGSVEITSPEFSFL